MWYYLPLGRIITLTRNYMQFCIITTIITYKEWTNIFIIWYLIFMLLQYFHLWQVPAYNWPHLVFITFIPSPGYSNVSFDSFTLLNFNFQTILFETVLRFLTNTVYIFFVYFSYIYAAMLLIFHILKRKKWIYVCD